MTLLKTSFLFIAFLLLTANSFAQTPKFVESKMSVSVDTNKLYGTLTMPLSKDPCAVMLLIAGSGHTDRDGNQPNLRSDAYRQLAEKLAEKGIATLRYDKRGVGESVFYMNESDLRFDLYIEDAVRWIDLLKKDKRFAKVVVAGHSEGSLIGMVASQRSVPNAYISIAGASRSIDQILKMQLVAAIPDTTYYILACNYIDTLKQGKLLTDSHPGLASLFRESIQPYMINWMKYDPSEEIKKLAIPVCIIQGETDIQVGLENAFELSDANPKAHVKIIKGMNHAMKTAELDREKNLAAYSDPTLPVVKDLIDQVQTFISVVVMR